MLFFPIVSFAHTIFFHSKPIAILLGHLKIPFEQIKQALLAMDEKKFSESHLKQLLLYAPDKEEVRKLKTNYRTVNQKECSLVSKKTCVRFILMISMLLEIALLR